MIYQHCFVHFYNSLKQRQKYEKQVLLLKEMGFCAGIIAII
jgi:hypothetical protein